MEDREDLRSILPFLPLVLRSSSLFWPPQVVVALKALSKGPNHSRVDSGEVLFLAISDMRKSLSLDDERLSSSAADGYALFFDDLISRAEAAKWFGEVVPVMADLLLRFPSLLEAHYQQADSILLDENGNGVGTGLRLLESQKPGIVFLSQELTGALLACSFFCLFPATVRGGKHLQAINFDGLFTTLYDNYNEKQENKIKCITHYFERICSSIPSAVVSFERKVLPFECSSSVVSYPQHDFWRNSSSPLCSFKVFVSGLIEDQPGEALEVDFANKYLGGGALRQGCVQEEIRFMINPELIAGMLFMASMADNEAIEIIGAERFSNYSGYASSFRFSGDYVDNKGFDGLRRRKTRIVAIDALSNPGKRQFRPDNLLREVNKAFCGFFNQSTYQQYRRPVEDDEFCGEHVIQHFKGTLHEAPLVSCEPNKEMPGCDLISYSQEIQSQHAEYQFEIGIATGNWGCGAFGGDPEVKAIIQWLAASQASRPFISYYTFGLEELHTLEQATQWILAHKWTVGELWNMLLDYSSHRLMRGNKTNMGFFSWLLPSLSSSDFMVVDDPPPVS